MRARATLSVRGSDDPVFDAGAATSAQSGAMASDRIEVRCATSALERLIGLVGQALPARGSGLWIEPCRGVHTFGMRGALDVVFVSHDGCIVRVCAYLPPRRIRWSPSSRAVLELRAGEAERLGLRSGTYLLWIPEPKGAQR